MHRQMIMLLFDFCHTSHRIDSFGLLFSNQRIAYFLFQEFGHRVRLATHANFSSFVKSAGIEFYPLGGDPRVLAGCKMEIISINHVYFGDSF